jgi:hypothetical protein
MAIEYREVVGFPAYRVGNDGSIWSRYEQTTPTPGGGARYVIGDVWRELKQVRDKREGKVNYLYVTLMPGKHHRFVHVLILEAFVGPRPPCHVARHFPDRDPLNNNLGNLSWGTMRQNQQDRLFHGTDLRGHKHPRAVTSEQIVANLRNDYATIKGCRKRAPNGWRQELAKKYGLTLCNVRHILKNDSWKHVV